MIRYRVSCENPASHTIEILMEFEASAATPFLVALPVWRPGRYEVGNFARNIFQVSATGTVDGALVVSKKGKSVWEVECHSAQVVVVRYTYYAFKMDAGSSWVHDDQVYLNPVNCLMHLPDRLNEPVEIILELPTNYKVACALKSEGEKLLAGNYHEVADSPLFASSSLTHLRYEVGGINFHIWYKGATDLKPEVLLADFEKFTAAQLALFGDLPLTDYHFLFQFLPYPTYHGVEHANSTVITLGPCTGEHLGSFYEKLLGISSHELFHAWNITRIRPAELLPYDFSKETYFRTGYVAEGFTTYYGDLMLVRSGVYDENWYLTELNKLLNRHFQNYGRFNQSVAESSFDLWLDGYQPGTPDRKVSIYVKGAIVALMLDMTLRIATGSKASLDNVMRLLWNDIYKAGKGYSESDIVTLAEKVAGRTIGEFFSKYVYGTTPVEEALGELAGRFGLAIQQKFPDSVHERDFGIKTKLEKEKLVIHHLHPLSRAFGSLSVDDEIISVNQVTEPSKLLAAFSAISKLQIKREGRTLPINLEAEGPLYPTYYLEKKTAMTDDEAAMFQLWIGGTR